MRALVTGGTGFVGSHMVELLLEAKWEVVCLVRDLSKLGHLTALRARGVRAHLWQDDWQTIGHVDYVFHIAGATRANTYEAYRVANVELTRSLLTACTDQSEKGALKRFVLVSSQAAAGPSRDGKTPVTESDPPSPVSQYGRSKLEAERVAVEFMDRLPITIIRPPTVFGPRDVDVLGVFRAARLRLAPHLAGPERWLSMIYAEDLADGILTAAQSPHAVGETYFLANPEPVMWREFALTVARILGYSAVPLPVPLPVMRVVALAGDFIGRATGSPRLLRSEKLEEAREVAWVCSTEKARKHLTWQPTTPLHVAIEKTARWYRANNWL